MIATLDMSCLEPRKYFEWNTRSLVIGKQEMSWLEQRKCRDWSTGNMWTGLVQTGVVFNPKSVQDPILVIFETSFCISKAFLGVMAKGVAIPMRMPNSSSWPLNGTRRTAVRGGAASCLHPHCPPSHPTPAGTQGLARWSTRSRPC